MTTICLNFFFNNDCEQSVSAVTTHKFYWKIAYQFLPVCKTLHRCNNMYINMELVIQHSSITIAMIIALREMKILKIHGSMK